MAKIYISYSNKDKELVYEVARRLRELGQQIFIDAEELTPGTEWRIKVSTALKSADGVICIITENSLHSQFVLTEIGQARAYLESKFLIPIIFGDIKIPPIIQDIHCLFADPNDLDIVIDKTIKAINFYDHKTKAEIEAREKETAKRIQKIESNASSYVNETMSHLKRREVRNRWIGNSWYTIGFICLLSGAALGFISIKTYLDIAQIEWSLVVILTLKMAIVVGLLIACSKYSFTLGKSYISEALKNADRTHAISFGKFYLDAYGANANWEELKEAFQHWNINGDNSFHKLDTNQYDPKFADMIIELSKIVKSKSTKD